MSEVAVVNNVDNTPQSEYTSNNSNNRRKRKVVEFIEQAKGYAEHKRINNVSLNQLSFSPDDENDSDRDSDDERQVRDYSAIDDLFVHGFVRNTPTSKLNSLLEDAWNVDPALTLKIIAHGRDFRSGGKGEKKVSIQALLWLREHKPLTYIQNLLQFLQLGCFKDLLKIAEAVVTEHPSSSLEYKANSNEDLLELELFSEFLKQDFQILSQKKLQNTMDDSADAFVVVQSEKEPFVMIPDSGQDNQSSTDEKQDNPTPIIKSSSLSTPVVVEGEPLIVEVCFVMDCTGSMGRWIQAAKTNIQLIVGDVAKDCLTVGKTITFRVSLVGYRDYFDKERYITIDFTTNIDKFLKKLSPISADGGGDQAEDLIGGLALAMKQSWSKNSVKTLILIADAPCHGAMFHSALHMDDDRSIQYQDPLRGKERNIVGQIADKDIRFSFVRIDESTDKMLEMFQSYYDDRLQGRQLQVLPLGNSVDNFLSMVVKTISASVFKQPIAVPEAKPKEVELEDEVADEQYKPSKISLSLAGKWAPGEGKHFDKAPLNFASRIRKCLHMPSKEYRKMLSGLREELNIVERQLCSNNWDKINFEHVPAVAHKLLQKAFKKHEKERYEKYLTQVKQGTANIKSVGIQPQDLTHYYLAQDSSSVNATVEAQWNAISEKALEDFRKLLKKDSKLKKLLTVVDVSGSMMYPILDRKSRQAQSAQQVVPVDSAIAMGLMISQLMADNFANRILTFADSVRMVVVNAEDSLCNKVRKVYTSIPNGGITDINAVYKYIEGILVDDTRRDSLPNTVIILTDMEFNDTIDVGQVYQNRTKEINTLCRRYSVTNIQFVFWNINGDQRGPKATTKIGDLNCTFLSGTSINSLAVVLKNQNTNNTEMIRQIVKKYKVVPNPLEI